MQLRLTTMVLRRTGTRIPARSLVGAPRTRVVHLVAGGTLDNVVRRVGCNQTLQTPVAS